jgi:hypothetical protein
MPRGRGLEDLPASPNLRPNFQTTTPHTDHPHSLPLQEGAMAARDPPAAMLDPAPIPCLAPPGDPAAAAGTAAWLQLAQQLATAHSGAVNQGGGGASTPPARAPDAATPDEPAVPHTGAPISPPGPGLVAGSPPGAWAATAAALHHLEHLLLAHPSALLACLEAACHAHVLPAAGPAAHGACAALRVLVASGSGGSCSGGSCGGSGAGGSGGSGCGAAVP